MSANVESERPHPDASASEAPVDTDPFVATPDSAAVGSHHRAATHAPPSRNRAVLFELTGANPGAVFSVYPSGVVIGRSPGADIIVSDGSISWRHATLTTRNEGVYVEDLRSTNGTFVNDRRIEESSLLRDGDYLRLGGGNTTFKFSMMDEFEENVLRNLFALTLRDTLTQLYNRRHFEERLHADFTFAERHGATLAIALISIDHFKTINARFGQQIGDAVLKLIAGSLVKIVRPDDVLARLDGGKFAVIVHAASERNAQILCERVCHRVAAISFPPSVGDLVVTVSAGLAQIGPGEYGESALEVFTSAQKARLEAIAHGGNRFCFAARSTRAAAPGERHPKSSSD